MSEDRRVRLWGAIVDQAAGATVAVGHACAVAISIVGIDSAAVAVALTATPRETFYASDATASAIEELMLTLGEGPGVEALSDGPALVTDLAAAGCLRRWPAFAPAAIDAGIRAMFALPLQVGGVHVGVMDLYRSEPGSISGDQLADALLLADTACALLLDSGHHDLGDGDGHRPEDLGPQHPEVHQATGMIAVQLGVTAAVALIRLRAYAYAHDQRLRDVAADVVARRTRFHPDDRSPGQ